MDETGASTAGGVLSIGHGERLAGALARAGGASALPETHARFRAQLGIDGDRAVVMSGHQAGFWHPGILAKYLVMVAAAERFDAEAVWLVVDQDVNDALSVRYPVLNRGERGPRLGVRTWPAAGEGGADGAERSPGVPTGRQAPIKVTRTSVGLEGASPGVADGLMRISEVMRRFESEPSLARQTGRGALELAAIAAGVDPGRVRVIFASELTRTELWQETIARAASDPRAVRETHNDAVRSSLAARIGLLSDGELPFWRVSRAIGSARSPARDLDLLSRQTGEAGVDLVPKALLLTGLLRAAGCDAFVHGTGGAGSDGEGGYDAITERWLARWGAGWMLSQRGLAPKVMATATVRLRFDRGLRIPSVEEVERAQWVAHAAEHRPGLLGEQESQRSADELIARLRGLRGRRDDSSRGERSRLYRELHGVIGVVRDRRAEALAELRARAQAAASRRDEAAIIADRTWAFPLYEDDQLAELWRSARAAVAVGRASGRVEP